MTRREFTAHGAPAPQGSKRVGRNRSTGRAVLIESSKQVKPWRAAVVAAWQRAAEAGEVRPVEGAAAVSIRFLLARPVSHRGTGRNAGRLRRSAPRWPAVKPDIDKLARAVLDALVSAGAVEDDARIVVLHLQKDYAAPGERTGAHIVLEALQ